MLFLSTDSPVDKIRGTIKSVPEPSPSVRSHISNPTNKSFISNTLKTDSKHCFSIVALIRNKR